MKIAVIKKETNLYNRLRIELLKTLMAERNIKTRVFYHTQEFAKKYRPDLVLLINAQEAKLSEFPTYCLLDEKVNFLLSRKRFIRNILMCDGYLAAGQFIREAVDDLMFSARKLDTKIVDFSIFPAVYKGADEIDFKDPKIIFFDYIDSSYFNVSYKGKLVSNLTKKSFLKKISLKKLTNNDIEKTYRENGIGIDFVGSDGVDKRISFRLAQIIASGALAITNYNEYIYEIFGDNILYIDDNHNPIECHKRIEKLYKWVLENPEKVKEKAKNAQRIYNEKFNINRMLDNFLRLHEQTLINKCFVKPAGENEAGLPSISYIMRTGGTPKYINDPLDSLVAQNYPKIQVLFVLYKPLLIKDEIIKKYGDKLKLKFVDDFKGLRSTGIVTGMKNVDTDFFGLLDDDDTLHSNHVRTMLKALNHSNKYEDLFGKRRFVYSGSYIISEKLLFPEQEEWYDEFLEYGGRKKVVEHFRFYEPNKMFSNEFFMMSNAWLAHKSLIDDEILRDTKTHSHEDIYFEIQFALKTYFVFSCEMTTTHYFHNSNSTIVDKPRNQYDVFRHITSLSFKLGPVAKFYRMYHHHYKEGISGINTIPTQRYPNYLSISSKQRFSNFIRSFKSLLKAPSRIKISLNKKIKRLTAKILDEQYHK